MVIDSFIYQKHVLEYCRLSTVMFSLHTQELPELFVLDGRRCTNASQRNKASLLLKSHLLGSLARLCSSDIFYPERVFICPVWARILQRVVSRAGSGF